MNFADEQGFSVKKAGGFGITVIMHLLLAGAVIYGLRTTFVSKPQIEEVQVVMPEAPPVVDPTPPPPKPPVKTQQVETPPIQPVEAPVPAPPPDPAPPQQATNDAPPSPNTNADSTVANGTPGVTSPAITDLNGCKPAYPQSALMQSQTGTVRVKFVIGTEGNLVSAEVVKSSGVKSLDRAAVDGLSKCKFKPAMQNGNPVQSWFVTDYVWSLQD